MKWNKIKAEITNPNKVCRDSSEYLVKPKKFQLVSLAILPEGDKYKPTPVRKTIMNKIIRKKEMIALTFVKFFVRAIV